MEKRGRRWLELMSLAGIALGTAGCPSDQGAMNPPCNSTLAIAHGVGFQPTEFFVGDFVEFSASYGSTADRGCDLALVSWRSLDAAILGLSPTTGQSTRVTALAPGQTKLRAEDTFGHFAEFDLRSRRNTGDLRVQARWPTGITGLAADIRATGPNNFDQALPANGLLANLAAGNYSLQIRDVTGPLGRYGATPSTLTAVVQKDTETRVDADYLLETGLFSLNVGGFGSAMPPPGPYATISAIRNGTAGTWDINALQGTWAYDPGPVTITPKHLDPQGFSWRAPTHSLNLQLGAQVTHDLNFAADNGGMTIITTGLPAQQAATSIVTSGQSSQTVTTPATVYQPPGQVTVTGNAVVRDNTATKSRETWRPSPATQVLTGLIVAGILLQLQHDYFLAAALQYYAAAIVVFLDPFNHKNFINMPALLTLLVLYQFTAPLATDGSGLLAGETVTISGPSPWVSVTGVLQANGSLTATGSGTVAGRPNVPVTFTGTLSNGRLVGKYKMGQDTAPTGLPNGSITYDIDAPVTDLLPP